MRTKGWIERIEKIENDLDQVKRDLQLEDELHKTLDLRHRIRNALGEAFDGLMDQGTQITDREFSCSYKDPAREKVKLVTLKSGFVITIEGLRKQPPRPPAATVSPRRL